MGGGFPAAAFGGRADVMHHLAPRGSRLPGRHPVREPDRHHRGPHHAAARDRRRLRPPRPGRGHHPRGGLRRARRRGGSPTSRSPTGTMFWCSSPRDRCATSTTPRAPTRWPTPPSSTRCSTRGSTSAVGVTRRGSSPPRTTSAPCRPSWTRCRRRARRRRGAAGGRRVTTPDTIVHLLRHGEVHNPDGVLYGRRDGFHLSVLGHRMAQRVSETLASATSSTCAPRRSSGRRRRRRRPPRRSGLDVVIDPRVIESSNIFEGQRFDLSDSILRRPGTWWAPAQPDEAVVGRAVPRDRRPDDVGGARREDRRPGARGARGLHQLPIWTTRLAAEGRSFLHNPRKRRCTLCSITSLHFVGDTVTQISYSEPAGDLIRSPTATRRSRPAAAPHPPRRD